MPLRIWVIGTRTSSAPSGKAIRARLRGGAGAAGALPGLRAAAAAGRGCGGAAAAAAGAGAAAAGGGAAASCLPTGWPVRWLST